MTTTLATPPARPSSAPQDFRGGLMGQTFEHLKEHPVAQPSQAPTPPVKQEALADRGIGQKVNKAV